MSIRPRHVVLTTAFASALFLMPNDGKAAEWKVGMSSPQVKELQQLLKEKGFFTYPTATGYFGPITEQAVKAFQSSARLPVTGIVDDATYAKLKGITASNAGMKIGSRGNNVKVLQQNLKQLGYFKYPEITGYFGTITQDAVKRFQQANGLSATGVADARTVQLIEKALDQRSVKASAARDNVLKIGSRGKEVSELQENLKLLGYFKYPEITGYYGTITADAVRQFQKQYQLPVTGTADSTTISKIDEAIKKKKQSNPSDTKGMIYLTIGSTGNEVKQVQTKLKQLGYFTYPKITGYYGTITADAVKAFQRDVNLKVTGIVDTATYERLIGKAPARKLDVIELVADAAELLGTPYVWGGQTPEIGFDCSGFVVYLFKKQGISLPRTVAMIWNVGKSVSSPSVGDMVFFETYKQGPSHVGIYIGNNQFIHSGVSTGVTISNLNNSYWKARYLGAKRYY
ncbi:NLP/P60 protein [Parageobacillus genomosp. 1]|uniref:NLP/P60 protein n=1 Tax=Parageobacillus genomosp. 1 TaxID=1295642 RepID=A0ABC9VAJ3_9BACL|nr:peptidoglycan-binding protein [Parageobacillus genomosp. 1]EZP75154.1 NLP/P60 protein [Parageobacillus genomosp. 1]